MKSDLDKHAAAYDSQNIYDFDNGIMMRWYPNRMLSLMKESASILELGLGHGYSTNIFSKHSRRHVVLEGSSVVIENFKLKFPKSSCEIIEDYFEKFDTAEKFDAIVMGFILEHVDSPQEILIKFKKFLAPNGSIFIAVPNAEVLNRRLGHASGMLPDMQALSENDISLGHKRYYTVNSLTEDILKSGYDIVRVEGIYLKPMSTKQMIAINFPERILEALCTVGMEYPELSCGIMAQLKPR